MQKHTITLRTVPKEITSEILDSQTEMKKKCSCNFSKEQTVYAIIRRWNRVKNYRVNGVPMSKIAEELGSQNTDTG